MKATLERELKFEAGSELELGLLGGEPLEERTFSSTYYDTSERRLLRAGLTLRRRMENGVGTWQLKLPREGARLELEEPGPPGQPPEPIAQALSGIVRGRELVPVATLRTRRSGRLVDGVEVTVDEVEVLEGQAVVDRFREVEAELVEGEAAAIERIGRRLRELGAIGDPSGPKLLRAVALPERRPLDRRAPTLHRLRAMVVDQYEELLRNDPLVRMTADADAVHDMRVAVRRLRSTLRASKRMLDPDWVDDLRAELDWLAGKLGAVRDLDVMTASLEEEAAALNGGDAAIASPLLQPLRDERDHARERLRAALEKARYLGILDVLETASAALPGRRVDTPVEKLAAKEFERLRKRARKLRTLDDASLHALRIQGKRARYAAELAGTAAGKRGERFVEAAKALQDVLGAHQDAVVAARRLRDLAHLEGRTDTALVAGRLVELQEQRKLEMRAGLPRVWRRVRKRGRRAFSR